MLCPINLIKIVASLIILLYSCVGYNFQGSVNKSYHIFANSIIILIFIQLDLNNSICLYRFGCQLIKRIVLLVTQVFLNKCRAICLTQMLMYVRKYISRVNCNKKIQFFFNNFHIICFCLALFGISNFNYFFVMP